MATPPTSVSTFVSRPTRGNGGAHPEHLLDRRGQQGRIGADRGRRVRVVVQADDAVAQRRRGRDVARDQQQPDESDDLLVDQPLPVHLGLDQLARQIGGWAFRRDRM